MNYLVTGATGELGAHALTYLKEQVGQDEIIALVRTEEKGKSLKEQGITVRIADFDNYASLLEAFKGIDRLLFISSQPGGPVSRDKQHQHVVQAAKEAGISFIVYTSFPKGDNSQSALAQDHILTENLIKESGIPHAILRNNWYLENESETIKSAVAGEPFVYSADEGKVGWALKREFAEAAIAVLTGEAQVSEVFELSGTPITYAELAEAVKVASGKNFPVESLTDDEYKTLLKNNDVPEAAIGFILMIQADIRQGELNVASNDFERVLGKPLTPLVDALKEVLGLTK